MEALATWLDELAQGPHERMRTCFVPVLTPGFTGLDLSEGIIATHPKGVLPARIGDTSPVAIALVQYVDATSGIVNLDHTEALTCELGALLTLAADRRIIVPKTLPLTVEGSNRISFLGYSGAADRRLHGPLPSGLQATIRELLEHIAGLALDVRPVIGAAARLHHAAVELFEADLRSAYLLLVAGVEVLSRQFGSPPTGWTDWEDRRA